MAENKQRGQLRVVSDIEREGRVSEGGGLFSLPSSGGEVVLFR